MLETDGHFREKLQAANAEDIKVRARVRARFSGGRGGGRSQGKEEGCLPRGQSPGKDPIFKRPRGPSPHKTEAGRPIFWVPHGWEGV